MAPIVIFGAGDIARLASGYFQNDSDHQVVAFTVDREYLREPTYLGLPVVPFDELPTVYPAPAFALFVAISYARMNRLRAAKCEAGRKLGYRLVSYVSSRCTWLSEHPPGDNCFILEDNTIQPGARIGHDVTLWSGNHVGHDCTIGDHCFVTSHVVISGWVRVGEYCFLGVNSTLRNSIRIAPSTLIGAGAVITSDTEEGGVYAPPRAVKLAMTSDQVEL
jgi:sugar O-acyltransferase (sialic acid O-acetyltransferase NeuD family)